MPTVDYEINEHVATITLDDPARRNALDVESALRIIEICDEIAKNSTIGAVVVRGANGTFCSGAARELLANAGQDPAEDENFESMGLVYESFVRIGELPVPTVAAACGASVGAGVNLLLATDLRIVALDARIITGFLKLGIHPGGGHFTLLSQLVGREVATAVGLFGEEISGAKAEELRIAWQALPADEVEPRADELARTVARDPALARKAVASLRVQNARPGIPWAAGLALERPAQMWSLRRKHGGTTP
ncbi:enoyl-CoA hydratase [Nocardioides sp. Root1257]|uniref:enoyl-CoA hydratase/isomerase family protein n=1 Tax=unclassified Nocardioides TaxID=2615069 RepID=UPI0006F87974|nr:MULTISPECIES: enoyl-CoA hydratase/isomerase family protein [unclassified Nocardioides]KQW42653.1 enoyl-CoA hydratase [Nocardioides sp. Root1257]KRC39911.1 enoyl-CoA hydratase [Nocardioides sp. Root224]